MKNTNNSVKKHQLYWVLLVAVLISGTANAKVNHYIGAYASLGEWSLMPSGSDYSTSFGVAGGAGCLYELQAGKPYSPTRFLFDLGLGLEGGMTAYKHGVDMLLPLSNQTDLQGDNFDYFYEVQNRRDQYNNMAVKVPLMIGVQHKMFYMLAGVKLGANVLTKAYTTANVNTFGRYFNDAGKQLYADFRNMPDYQFFNDYQLKERSNASLDFNVDASFEIGGRLGIVNDAVGYDVPKRKIEYRLAAFVDYGLLDIHVGNTLDPLVPAASYDTDPSSANYVYQSSSMVNNLEVNDIMSTANFADKVTNFMVGLKFTVLFQLPEAGECVICRDSYRSSVNRRRGRLKYEE